jgi:hypothetical protein
MTVQASQSQQNRLVGPLPSQPELISGLTTAGNALVFGSYAPSTPGSGISWTKQLWRSDGTPDGTQPIKDLVAVPIEQSAAIGLHPGASSNGVRYFEITSYNPPLQLWRSDGTPDGTFLVKPLAVPMGVQSRAAGWHDQLLFLDIDDRTASSEVYITDGSQEGTRRLFSSRELLGGEHPLLYTFDGIWPTSRGFFVRGRRPPYGFDVWYSDGTREHTQLVFSSQVALEVSVFADRAWLSVPNLQSAQNPAIAMTLWVSDGTIAGTQAVGVMPDSTGLWSRPQQLGERMLVVATYNSGLPLASFQVWDYPSGPEAYLATAALVGGAPAGRVGLPLRYGNLGTATGALTLTATLPPGVTLASDTLGVAPQVNGDTISWNLPALALVENRDAAIELALPDAPYGTRLPVSFAISRDGASTTPDDTAELELMVAHQVFLPSAVR